jgi:hypothetical protein
MIKSRRMGQPGHVACIDEKWNAYMVLVGKPEGRRPLETPSGGGRAILRWVLVKWDRVECNGPIGVRKGTSGGLL